MIDRYAFKMAMIEVSLAGRTPTFAFRSETGEVRLRQLVLWRQGEEQPVWAIVVDTPPHEYCWPEDQPPPETERELLEAMAHDSLTRMTSGEGSLQVLSLRYGEVPKGFLQQRPLQQRPAPLTPGDYFLSIAGEYTGSAGFRIDGP